MEDAAKSRFLGLSEEEKKAIRKEEKDRGARVWLRRTRCIPAAKRSWRWFGRCSRWTCAPCESGGAPPERRKFQTYRVTLCDVEVEYSVDDETKVCTMLGGAAVKPLDRPGETKRDASRVAQTPTRLGTSSRLTQSTESSSAQFSSPVTFRRTMSTLSAAVGGGPVSTQLYGARPHSVCSKSVYHRSSRRMYHHDPIATANPRRK